MLNLQSDDNSYHSGLDGYESPRFKLDYIKDIQYLALDFDLHSELSIEDIIVAEVEIDTPDIKKTISLNVVDYLLIRTAYGVNLNFMEAIDPEFKSLESKIRDDLGRSLIAAMEARELDFFFRGHALEEFFKLLGLSQSTFCQMTNISLNQILNAMKGTGEISQYTYLNMLSMYRLLNTTLSLPSAVALLDERTFNGWPSMANLFDKVDVPDDVEDRGDSYFISHTADEKEHTFEVRKADLSVCEVNEILEQIKPSKKLRKYIRTSVSLLKKLVQVNLPENCTAVTNGYVVSASGEAYAFDETEIKYYRLGLVKRLLKNKKVKPEHEELVKLALSQLVTYHFKKLYQQDAAPSFQVNEIVQDSSNSLAYNRELPSLCTGGISLTFNEQEIFLTSADLFDVHAGLAFPMVVVNAGATVCEELYKELDFIAHQYFINEPLYNSTWVDINKEFKISKADLVSYKIHDLSGRFNPDRADKIAPSWQFLMLPIVANEVAGEA